MKDVCVAILTKSKKFQGYCVAGIDVASKRWVRLVSDDGASHGALLDRDMRYRDGTRCEVLDVARVPILRDDPKAFQPENVLIDRKWRWEKAGRLTLDDVLRLHEDAGIRRPALMHPHLFGNEHPFLTQPEIERVGQSLIGVIAADLSVSHPLKLKGSEHVRKPKAAFTFSGNRYAELSVTDPDYCEVPPSDEPRFTSIRRALLILSLPDEPYPRDNAYYKFIAKIFPTGS